MMEMTIHQLLPEIHYIHYEGDETTIVRGVALDSRQIETGGLYVAIKGTQLDGEDFISDAIQNGAVIVVTESPPDPALLSSLKGWIQVPDARKAAAEISACFYDYPDRKIQLVGVTGTNGKSSVVLLLYELFRKLGYKTGVFSTVHNLLNDTVLPSRLTTPDAVSLYRDMAAMVEGGCDYVFMEVSSHALDQNRVLGLEFDVAVFTNLTHDHLDYHGSFKEYLNTKKKLFDHLSPEAMALVNEDDKNAGIMVQNTEAKVCTYALRTLADYHAKVLEMDFDTMKLMLDGREVITRITGKFNAYNLLAVYAVADYFEVEKEELLRYISELKEVRGRFQRVVIDPKGPFGIVDYAHTPDAVEQLASSASDLVSGKGRLIMVLGSGGNRDVTKRPKMARAATSHADIVILTSDNPRMEDPEKIIEDMFVDLFPHHQAKTFKIQDRREAIRMAVSMAQRGDLVVVAGKGHEGYQEIKGKRIPFDDVRELEKALTEKLKK